MHASLWHSARGGRWTVDDLAREDPTFRGRCMGSVMLPFYGFYADHERGVSILFSDTSQFAQANQDMGTRLRLKFVPDPDDGTNEKFHASRDGHPIWVFKACGQTIWFRGLYVLTKVERDIGKWELRRLSGARQADYPSVERWLEEMRAAGPERLAKPTFRRLARPRDAFPSNCKYNPRNRGTAAGAANRHKRARGWA